MNVLIQLSAVLSQPEAFALEWRNGELHVVARPASERAAPTASQATGRRIHRSQDAVSPLGVG